MYLSALSRGMILLSGRSGPEFESRSGPVMFSATAMQDFDVEPTTTLDTCSQLVISRSCNTIRETDNHDIL